MQEREDLEMLKVWFPHSGYHTKIKNGKIHIESPDAVGRVESINGKERNTKNTQKVRRVCWWD